ncbi:MAG TPA: 2-phosphosulfolactate phosphatase [Actinokineospora sp.]|nr:2-phosphosulfolactate phosphatase [Actinokineospora sp.]
MDPSFEQSGFDVRVEWGLDGVAALAGKCGALVIVDVLSFSTSVDIAVSRGGRVLPVRYRDERAQAEARAAGAMLPGDGPWTLRPSSLTALPTGTFLALPSPNGATLSAVAAETGVQVFAGCLRNAAAVAAAVRPLGPVGIVAASERWGHVGALRPCVEDQLGAGAIAHALGGARSPEARVAEAAFLAFADDLHGVLRECSSGRELIAAGHAGDVELAAGHGASTTVPTLVDGVYQ